MLHLYEPALLKLSLIGLESSFQQADGLISRLPGCDSGRLQGSLWFGLVILLTWRARSYCRRAAEELPLGAGVETTTGSLSQPGCWMVVGRGKGLLKGNSIISSIHQQAFIECLLCA